MENFEKNIYGESPEDCLSEEGVESMGAVKILGRPRDFSIVKEHKQEFSLDIQKIINELAGEEEVWLSPDDLAEFQRAIDIFWENNPEILWAQQNKIKQKIGARHDEEALRMKQIEREFRKELGNMLVALERIAERMRQEGLPLENDCRIDMEAFKDIYSEEIIKKDKKQVGYEKRIARFDSNRNIAGEKLEILKTILFNKFLGDRFAVVRSSYYDDISNGVDNVLIERETGSVVCMFDNILQPNRDKKFYGIKKIEKVRNINKKGGAQLKYGIDLRPDGQINLRQINNIPIFALVLDGRYLNKIVEKVKVSPSCDFALAGDVFRQMVGSLKPQIEMLKKDRDLLSDELVGKLDNFEKNLDKLKIIN